MEALPRTAQRILAAARRLLVRDGFTALTLSAIADEAQESKASIGYHFGNKDGLVAALVDSLTHDANPPSSKSAVHCRLGPPDAGSVGGESRNSRGRLVVSGFLRGAALCASGPGSSDGAWRLSTTAIARPSWRCIRDTDPAKGPELRSFCALMIAIVDGLAIQYCLDPKGPTWQVSLGSGDGFVLPAGRPRPEAAAAGVGSGVDDALKRGAATPCA